jgi:hypothetical protein
MIIEDSDQTRTILRLCLRSRWQTDALGKARGAAEAAGPGSWEAVRCLAEREGLAPLLYHVAHGQDLLPPDVEERLRLAYYATARQNLLSLHELERVLTALSAAGIPAIVLKGAALIQAVYQNPALRPMADLDLLLRPADVRPAIDILTGLGYQATGDEPHPGHRLIYETQIIFRRPGSATCPVEPHWHLFDSPYYQRTLPIDWFWQTGRPFLDTHGLNRTGLLLSPEGQLLHLCGHLALHHGAGEEWRELWLYDIAAAVAWYGEQIDWSLLLAQAQACELVLPVQRMLARAARDWQAPLPGSVLDQLLAIQPTSRERRLFQELTAAHRPAGRRFWTDLTTMQGWRARAQYAWTALVPSAAYMRQHYRIRHRWLVPAYYPYRWWVGLRGLLTRPAPGRGGP